MADTNTNTRPPITERCMTIQRLYRSNSSPHNSYPWIRLSGRWLEYAGFIPGQRVKINVEHGRLIITPE